MKHTDGDGTNRGDQPIRADWTRADFEAALPLHVGGDLDPEDAARVDAWVAAHPEDADVVRAAMAARNVLLNHARSFEQRATPDLWPGIREELARIPVGAVGGDVGAGESAPPILRGPTRWYERRIFAAAAAVLLVGTIGLALQRSGPSDGRAPAEPSADGFASAVDVGGGAPSLDRGAVVRGSGALPFDVTTVRSDGPEGVVAQRRGVPFRATGGDAEHLVQTASPVLVWRRATQAPPLQGAPLKTENRGLRLTGDR